MTTSYGWHNFIYRLARHTVAPLSLKKYQYRTDIAPKDLKAPYIVMANHLTESDLFMVGSAFPQQMYVVCGEHVMTTAMGKGLEFLNHPIPAPKGGSMLPVIKEMTKRIKAGRNILIFPEGSRSFDGVTLKQDKNAAKLVKMTGASLVTYRQHGGYFVAPRWGYHFRKGPCWGEIVNIYTAEQIKEMSVQELTDAINADIYENAQETQNQYRYKYVPAKKGQGLAEGLENYLLLCPECGAYDSMEAKGDDFACKCCGTKGHYNEYGDLEGDKLRFHTVADWGDWMAEEYDRQYDAGELPLPFVEKPITLSRIDTVTHAREQIASGQLAIDHDSMRIGEYTFFYKDISVFDMLYFGKTLVFTDKTGYYSMTGEAFHAWKAERLIKLSKRKQA